MDSEQKPTHEAEELETFLLAYGRQIIDNGFVLYGEPFDKDNPDHVCIVLGLAGFLQYDLLEKYRKLKDEWEVMVKNLEEQRERVKKLLDQYGDGE